MEKHLMKSVLACSIAFLGSQVQAAETGAAGIAWGPVSVYPSLGFAMENDDNIYLSNIIRQSSVVNVVSPAVRFEAHHHGDIYALTYHADLGRYNSANNNNYNDQHLVGQFNVGLSMRAAIKLRPEYSLGHDPIGTTYGGFTSVPNRWRNTGISGVFGYGAENAKGRIELSAGTLITKYLNNRFLTYAYDKTTDNAGATFFYRVMPKTSLLFEASDTRYVYDSPTSLIPNNSVRNYLVGAKWEATAKTTGDFRIGQVQQRYDGGVIPNYTGTGWSGTIQWNPKTYSKVKLDLSRQPLQTTLVGTNLYLVTSSTVDWAYDLNSRFTSHLNYNRYTEDFGGLGLLTKNNSYGIGMDYRMRRWLKTSLSWTNWSKTANQIAFNYFDYNRNVVMLTLTGTL